MPRTRSCKPSFLDLAAGHSSDSESDESVDDVPISELFIHKSKSFINDDEDDEEDDEDDEEEDEEKNRGNERPLRGRILVGAVNGKAPANSIEEPSKKVRARIQDKIGRDASSGFEDQYVGFYHSKSREDLPIAWWDKSMEFFRRFFVTHTMGRERGDGEEHVHHQGQGHVFAPSGATGLAALTRLYKEFCGVPTLEGHKVQFKLLDLVGQPEEKMIAYTFKDSGKAHFKFDSSDANGEPLSEDYIKHCQEIYKVCARSNNLILCDSRSVGVTRIRKLSSTVGICSKSLKRSNE